MRLLLCLVLLSFAPSAFAQPEVIFGSGKKPIFKEQEPDRRFLKSKLNKMLYQGPPEGPCLQVAGAMLTALGEVAPYLHKRDENFQLDPAFMAAFNQQLNNAQFPGTMYLVEMVRRVWIDGRLPREWLDTAERINPAVRIIDVNKLRFLAEGLKPIDSSYFTLALLKQRYELEVLRATSAARDTAYLAFRDSYLDREVTWGNFQLLDVGPRKTGRGKHASSDDSVVATLELIEQSAADSELQIFMPKVKTKTTRVIAELADHQFMDLYKIPKGKRVLVRGRLWEFNKDLTQLELRDALIFEDRDWSMGALLADPATYLQCPAAINELTGTAPQQPGGFAH
jgi:hypothetical protein